MLTDSSINFNQNEPSSKINSKIFYNASTGLNIQNLSSTSAKNIRLNSTGDIRLQSTGEVILTRANISLSTVLYCNTLYQPGNLFLVVVPLPLPQFIISETYDDLDLRLPNAVVDGVNIGNGAHCFLRLANNKSCTVAASYTTGNARIYNIANASAVSSVNCSANQNYSFLYHGGYWYTMD